MSPAVAEREAPTGDQPLVSQPDQSALFMATRSNLRLVWESIRTVRDAEGVAVDKTMGKTLEFREGVLRVPLDPAREVTLTNGESAPAAEALRFLEKHRLNGDWQEGFWRVDPTAPPPSQAELDMLQTLALDLDAEGLERFIAEESGGWKRTALIEVAQGTLERVQGKLDQLSEQLAAARAEGRAEGEAGKGEPKGPRKPAA